jgi:hypothetical protein
MPATPSVETTVTLSAPDPDGGGGGGGGGGGADPSPSIVHVASDCQSSLPALLPCSNAPAVAEDELGIVN